MIVVTRLNSTRFAVNPDLIERVQASPDTTLSLVGGATYVVTETVDEVVALVAGYRARVIALAQTAAYPPFEREKPGELVGITSRRGHEGAK